jgi:hypothetical protein
VVQAVLGGAIVLTAAGARLLYGMTLRRVDQVACAACAAGLVLVAASAGAERPDGPPDGALLVLVAAAGLLVVGLVASWSATTAWPLALLAGLGFGGSSVAVRAVHLTAGEEIVGLLTLPATYLVIVFGTVGLIAYSRALAHGNLARVTAILLVTEVTVPGLAGIVLLGDSVRAGWWGALTAGLVLAVAGVVVLAGSPTQQPPPRPAT